MKFLITLIAFAILYLPLQAQNYDPMQDDIEIMETILDKMMLKQKSKLWYATGRTSGYYLDKYGILFKVPYSMENAFIFNQQLNNTYHLAIQNFHPATPEDEDEEIFKSEKDFEQEMKKETEKIKQTLTRFLGDYVSTMNYLKPDYWITIIVDSNESMQILGGFHVNNQPQQLIAKVQMKDILSYRKGAISFDAFKQKVQFFSKANNLSAIDEEVNIFSDILESYLERNEKDNKFTISSGVKGFYLEGYGAIFLLSANMEPNIINIFTKGDGEKNFSFSTITTTEDAEHFQERVDLLQNKIINLVSRYGHTLKKLSDQEALEIALNLNTHQFDEDYSKIVLKIQKNYIENLNRQKINLDEFKRHIQVIKY